MGNWESCALVVDPHDVTRWGIAQLVTQLSGFSKCLEANSIAAVQVLESSVRPALIVCECCLPDGTVFDLLEHCRRRDWNSRVLVCSGDSNRKLIVKAIAEGASGFVSKLDSLEQLRQSILKTLNGQITISANLSPFGETAALHPHRFAKPLPAIDKLTDREQEIFELVARGLDVSEIALQLSIASKTVEAHRQNIRKKMGLRSMSELIGKAAVWLHQSS